MRPSLQFTQHQSHIELIRKGNIPYLQYLHRQFERNLLPEHYEPPYHTFWPIAFMNPEGDLLWTIAEVAAEHNELYLVWHFPTGSNDIRDKIIGYNSHLVLQTFYDLFTGPGWRDCKLMDRNAIPRIERHEIPQTQFLHDSGAHVALALAHRILR